MFKLSINRLAIALMPINFRTAQWDIVAQWQWYIWYLFCGFLYSNSIQGHIQNCVFNLFEKQKQWSETSQRQRVKREIGTIGKVRKKRFTIPKLILSCAEEIENGRKHGRSRARQSSSINVTCECSCLEIRLPC